MSTILKIILISLFLIGCNEDEYRSITRIERMCDQTTTQERASFTLDCIRGANPKSDEEPEDWIDQCRQIAKRIYCHNKIVKRDQISLKGTGYWIDQRITIIQE